MVRYDGFLNTFHSLNFSRLTHPTGLPNNVVNQFEQRCNIKSSSIGIKKQINRVCIITPLYRLLLTDN